MKALDRKSLALLIALTIALAEAIAVLYLVFVQLRDLQSRYQELWSRVRELEEMAESASRVYASAYRSVVTVEALRGDGSIMQGSGFIYDGNGSVVTSFHVVSNATSITVVYYDMVRANATLLGGDVYTDIAVVRVEPRCPLCCQPLPLGNSSALKVGETVYAVGSPYGLASSLSAGVVGAKERLVQLAELGVAYPHGAYAVADLVQFDASVGPGSSGCPLLNSRGEVVGVVFAMRGCLAFAVSSDIMRRVASGIIANGRYNHPWLGVGYDPTYVGGMKVLYVLEGSPAERTGLMEGDVITAVDGWPVRSAQELITYIEKRKSPGDIVLLSVERNGLNHLMQLQLGARP